MKRRNAETGRMRRPMKRTKISEGILGSPILYLKFIMLWVAVLLVDKMLQFRFEFFWPFWMMLRSVIDSYKYQGLVFTTFFICLALTCDLVCFYFVPVNYVVFAASTFVEVQSVWYLFADKGAYVPTVIICCIVIGIEWFLPNNKGGGLSFYPPLAAHCVGYPAVTLTFSVNSYVVKRLRLRKQRQVRQENEFFFQLMRDALPESALEQNQQQSSKDCEQSVIANGVTECAHSQDMRHMNGSVRRKRIEPNGLCGSEHTQLQAKLDKLEKHLSQQTSSRDKSTHTSAHANGHANTNTSANTHCNGIASGAGAVFASPADDEDKHDHSKGCVKSSKCEKKEANNLREEKRKNKNKDKDKDKDSCDSHKSTEQTKEHIVKEVESTKENVKSNRECNNNKDKEREKEKEREAREREKERERERERELREARECAEELRRVRAELAAARSGEAEAKRALAAAAAAERQRRQDHNQLKQAHASLQHKVSVWRSGERAVLERRLGEERRARTAAEHQLRSARNATRTPSGECDSEWCRSRRSAAETETAALRRELQRARDRGAQLQRDLAAATDQVRSLESRQQQQQQEEPTVAGVTANRARLAGAWQALQERAAHLERSLSAETRVKLDLLSALGDAKRHMHLQEGLISRQEKEIEELKAQMLAVMPTEFVTPVSGTVSKLRLSDGSPLDPNASVYTPKQLCSDA